MSDTDRRRLMQGAVALAAAAAATSADAQATPIRVIAELFAKPGQEEALRKLLTDFAVVARKEPGCVSYDLLQVQGDPGHFVTYELWADKAALDAHMATPEIKAALPIVGPMLAKPFSQSVLSLISS